MNPLIKQFEETWSGIERLFPPTQIEKMKLLALKFFELGCIATGAAFLMNPDAAVRNVDGIADSMADSYRRAQSSKTDNETKENSGTEQSFVE